MNIAFNRDAFGLAPTHARLFTRSSNTSNVTEIAMKLATAEGGDFTPELEFEFGNITYTGSGSGTYLIDTGWVRIPLAESDYVDFGFISGLHGAPAGGTTTTSAYTMLLGVEM